MWARACAHNIVFTCGCNGITTTSASRRAFHLCLGDVTFRLQWWYFHKSKVNSYRSLVWKPLAFHFLLPVHDQQPTHNPNQALMSGPAYRPAFLHGRRGCLRWLAGDGGGGNSFAAMRSQSWHGNGPHLRFSFGDVRTKQTQCKRVWQDAQWEKNGDVSRAIFPAYIQPCLNGYYNNCLHHCSVWTSLTVLGSLH